MSHEHEEPCGEAERHQRPAQDAGEFRPHANADGWNTDMTCASISSRLAKRLSS